MKDSSFLNIPDYGSSSWKSPVATEANLPISGNDSGDARVTLDTQSIYIWSGSEWVEVSGGGGGGDVVGPSGSIANDIPTFSDTTGLVLQDSGVNLVGPGSGTTILSVNNSDLDPLDFTLIAGQGVSSHTNGGATHIKSGNGVSGGRGGAITIVSGSGSTGNSGGALTVTAGRGNGNGTGGNLTLGAGDSDLSGGSGGNVTITSGLGSDSTGNSGNISIIAQDAAGSSVSGGTVILQAGAGAGTGAQGGNIQITAGQAAVDGTRGSIEFLSSNDGTTPVVVVDPNNNIFIGTGALSTSATGGFVSIPSTSGTPTGTPSSIPSGLIPIIYDSGASELFAYNGSWLPIGGGSGITSINTDTTSSQLIVGGTNISVSTISGTTTITNNNLANVIGPSTSSASDIPVFSDTTGKLISDSGLKLSGTTTLILTPSSSSILSITGYNNASGVGSAVNITAGSGTSANGGALNLVSGAGGSTNTAGGVTLKPGISNASTQAPSLSISGGANTGTGGGGAVVISGGQTSAGTVQGPVTIQTGFAGSQKQRIQADGKGNVFLGANAALATSATDGFVSIPSMAGIPSGTPTLTTGLTPIVYDTTDSNFYIYSGGAWILFQNIQPEFNAGSSSSVATINFLNSTAEKILLTGASTLTITGTKSGGAYVLRVIQDGVGGHTCSITGVLWSNGSPPTFSTGANAIDIVNLYSDGTNLYGSFASAFA